MKISKTSSPTSEKLTMLGMFLEEHGYEIKFLAASLKEAMTVVDENGSFLITSREGTKVCICNDGDIIELAAPDSFQLILDVIKFCKETYTKQMSDRCHCCPLRKKK